MDPFVRSLAEVHPAAILLSNATGSALFANAAWHDLLGPALLSMDQWRDLIAVPDDIADLPTHTALIAEATAGLATGTLPLPRQSLARLHTHSEAPRWWSVQHVPVLDDGMLLGWLTVLTLIIDRSEPGDVAWSDQRLLSDAQRIAHIGAWIWEIPSGELRWSDEVYRIFGFPPQAFPASYEIFLESVHPDDRAELQARVERAIAGLDRYDLRHRILTPDGVLRYVREQGEVTRDPLGAPIRMVGTVLDVTEETLAEQAKEQVRAALAVSEARYRLLAEHASDVVWQENLTGSIEWVSESVEQILGWSPEALRGRNSLDLVHPADRERAELDTRDLTSGRDVQATYRILAADGSSRWMACSAQVTNSSGTTQVVGTLRDVNDEMAALAELERVVGHDALTGLGTRSTMATRLAHLESSLPAPSAIAVLCVGVDELTSINAAFTHAVGDRVLAAVASRVVSVIGDPDRVGRGSGNEVFVLVPDLDAGADAAVIAERIRAACHDVLTVGSAQVKTSVSIGIATGHRDSDPEQLLRDASVALQQAKLHGHDRAEFIDLNMAEEARNRLMMEQGIQQGIARGEFQPHFQPIVRLRDRAVLGYEALVRWIPPDRPPIEAWRFVTVAERSSLIVDLDLLMLRKSLAAITHHGNAYVAVNVSATSLKSPEYAEVVLQSLAAAKFPAARLHLEVTETTLLSIDRAVLANMRSLANSGIAWYVDDFGTGYSSISHLRDLPIAGLKLDRSFTHELSAATSSSAQLASALAGLARGLALDTVAEGVETEQQAELLKDQGWLNGQGWLFGRPGPLA